MARLRTTYNEKIGPRLVGQVGYSSSMQAPTSW